jgi:hypothetical protein
MKYRNKGTAEKPKNKTKEVEKGSIRWQIADFRLQIGGFIHRFTQIYTPIVQRFKGCAVQCLRRSKVQQWFNAFGFALAFNGFAVQWHYVPFKGSTMVQSYRIPNTDYRLPFNPLFPQSLSLSVSSFP